MKIDKNRFLLLTTALAASTAAAIVVGATGCESKALETNTRTTDSGTFTPVDSGSSAIPDATTTDASDGGVCLGDCCSLLALLFF